MVQRKDGTFQFFAETQSAIIIGGDNRVVAKDGNKIRVFVPVSAGMKVTQRSRAQRVPCSAIVVNPHRESDDEINEAFATALRNQVSEY